MDDNVFPDTDDVVVRAKVIRAKDGKPPSVYIVGTPSAPVQFSVGTRDEAISKALAFAKRAHVAAWLTDGDDDFVPLTHSEKQ